MNAPFQQELFAEHKSPLFGTQVKFDGGRHCRRCGNTTATIGRTAGPHYALLICTRCNTGCGWLSKSTANWLENIVSKFGAPTAPIVLRRPAQ